ncbi:folylpolyglutamate synthase [Tulasnella sp. JGI-2019a]|nr:folylpolyglutamate synthase [Tulasnella sp. JGI-2019a]
MDLSLARISSLLAALPQYTRPTIHIAGTNGKGSVTAILDSILRDAGFKTGRFNSPHFLFVRDSIRIDGQAISQTTYDHARDCVVEKDISIGSKATSFEILTATAFRVFEAAQVDVVLLEVGLGGRLDATNAVPKEAVIACGITAIDLDHQAMLGDTVEAIAREKAGIMKSGVTCVVGRQGHSGVLSVMREVAGETKAKLVFIEDSCVIGDAAAVETGDPASGGGDGSASTVPTQPILVTMRGAQVIRTRLALLGTHQLENVALAVTILEQLPSLKITPLNIAQGIRNTRWPGRLHWTSYTLPVEINSAQRREMRILVDGAHNTASAHALAAYLHGVPRSSPRHFILSLSDSPPPKTPLSTLTPLLMKGDIVALVPFSQVAGMPWVKPVATEVMNQTVRQLTGSGEGRSKTFASLEEALGWFSTMAEDDADTRKPPFVIVTGSLYLVADMFRLLDGENL